MLALVLILPALILLGLFLLLPICLLMVASLQPPPGSEAVGFGVTNYVALLDWYYGRVLLTTMRIGASVTILCVLLAYPVSYFLARARGLAARLGMFLVVLPLMISAVIAAYGWLLILGRNGALNSLVTSVGFEPLRLLNTETAVVIALTQLLLPYMILPITGSIERIPPVLEEAARNLGGHFGTVWWHVIVPLSRPGLISGAILVFSIAISSLVIPAMLGGRVARMAGNDIFEYLLVSFNWPMASALSFALVLTIGLVAILGLLLLRGLVKS